MKNAPLVLSALALLGVLVLFGLHFSRKGKTESTSSVRSSVSAPANGARIAWVNIDTLEANFEYLKRSREAFGLKQQNMERELQGSYQAYQRDGAELQRKAAAGTLTQAEAEAGKKRLAQMEQTLQTRDRTMTQQLAEEQAEFNKDLRKRFDSYFEEYNKDKHYDYILSYTIGSNIMFADKKLEITQDVIKGMNQRYGGKGTDSTSKK